MFTLRNELETLFLISLAFLSVLLIFQFHQPKKSNTMTFAVETIANTIHPSPTPQITQAPFIPKITTSSVTSADGKMKLIMNAITNKNNTTTYNFFLNDAEKNNLFFSEIASSSTALILPFNSWSPDNGYFYIEETNPSVIHAFVFKASGQSFSNGQQYVDMIPLYNQKVTTYKLKEVTGWASDTLLIINTTAENNIQGQSYWFDVPSESFIELSTKF